MAITEIKIQGKIDVKWKDWFDGLEIKHHNNNTILKCDVKDQSSLYGIINKLRDLNLTLISINQNNNKEFVDNKKC